MTDYGRTLDIASSGGECPTPGVYTFEITGVTDPAEKPGFNAGDIDIQSHLNVKLSGYQYDEDDEDDYDWNGENMRVYAVWARRPVDDPNKIKAIYKSPRANAYKLLTAIYPELNEDTIKTYVLDLDALVGRKFQAMVTEKENGYPKIGEPMPIRAKKPKAKVATPPTPTDDDDLFDDPRRVDGGDN